MSLKSKRKREIKLKKSSANIDAVQKFYAEDVNESWKEHKSKCTTEKQMNDVTLKNSQTLTDAEFVKEWGRGDTLTDFVATKADLKSLAHRIADELLGDEFYLLLQVSRAQINARDYTRFRLNRVMAFLPEQLDEIREKLRLGYIENEADYNFTF